MEYESPKQMAERLGVTVRAVQKWAAAGKLRGAKKTGRDWLIPKGLPDPRTVTDSEALPTVEAKEKIRSSMPLLSGSFEPGKSREYIESIPDEDDRNIALGEYYYYSGQAEEAAKMLEPYLTSKVPALKYSADFVLAFVNISLGRTHLARFTITELEKQNREGLRTDSPIAVHAIGVMTAHAIAVLFHRPVDPDIPPLEDYLRYLSGGMKLWACYVLAYRAFQDKNYDRALTIAELALSLVPNKYPIPVIYCMTVEVVSLLGLKRVKEAKEKFSKLWDMIKEDGFVEIISEHYGSLQGIVDASFRENGSESFELLRKSVRNFGLNWIKVYNQLSDRSIADNLSATEFTVAMLYNRGWSAQEIAVHLSMSEHTVRSYIKAIYIKLGISDRKALSQFMLH